MRLVEQAVTRVVTAVVVVVEYSVADVVMVNLFCYLLTTSENFVDSRCYWSEN